MKYFETVTEINPETIGEKVYDMCMIEQLCHGNEETIKKMVKVFIDQVPKVMAEIKKAYIHGDLLTVRKKAHQVRPTLGYYAIIKIEKDIKQIEKLAKAGVEITELGLKIARVDEVLNQVVEKMKQDFMFTQ
jgi:HPt (histidine-containing phosphotransfer) domain-containing protein